MAFTSGGSDADVLDDSPHAVEVRLVNNQVEMLTLQVSGINEYTLNKGDLWEFDFSEFGFSQSCITNEDVDRVSIVADSTDGWTIQSIVTFVRDDENNELLLTKDFDVNRRIDSNSANTADRRFALTMV